jgi:hypothetical protein
MPLKHSLPYFGALPFLFAAVLLLLGVNSLPVLGEIARLVAIYGLVIASFMAGCHWGMHLTLGKPFSIWLPITSNVIAVFLWLVFSMLPQIFMWGLIAAFLVLVMIDYCLDKQALLPTGYWKTRLMVTALVVVSLLIIVSR